MRIALMATQILSIGTYYFYYVLWIIFSYLNLDLYLSWVLNLSGKYTGTQKRMNLLEKQVCWYVFNV